MRILVAAVQHIIGYCLACEGETVAIVNVVGASDD
jgi:hypothetical protein